MIMPTAAFLANPLTSQGFPSKSRTSIDWLPVSTRHVQGLPTHCDTLTTSQNPVVFKSFLIGVNGAAANPGLSVRRAFADLSA
jgi:hypothetical protein